MPLDSTQTGLGYELASLRALGADRRRQSLVSRLLRERRNGASASAARVRREMPKAPAALPVRAEP